MELKYKVLQLDDLNELLQFEQDCLSEIHTDEMERMLAGWNSRARKEALEHYLPLGWSFAGVDDQGKIRAYFLAQPYLFFQGQTQSLWVEHIQTSSQDIHHQLCEIAYKMAREKHFQRVYFPDDDKTALAISSYKPLQNENNIIFVKTTKG